MVASRVSSQEIREANLAAIAELESRTRKAAAGGGEAAHEKQRARGKLPVQERIDRVLDPGSAFLELSPLAAGKCWLSPTTRPSKAAPISR
jgi:3-methylcrotonyl-CoA carboxylase beta subunit